VEKMEFTLIARSYESLTPGLMTFLEEMRTYVGLNFNGEQNPKRNEFEAILFQL
jgi:hypothetical protein